MRCDCVMRSRVGYPFISLLVEGWIDRFSLASYKLDTISSLPPLSFLWSFLSLDGYFPSSDLLSVMNMQVFFVLGTTDGMRYDG